MAHRKYVRFFFEAFSSGWDELFNAPPFFGHEIFQNAFYDELGSGGI